MSGRRGQKIKIIALLDILKKESDEDNPLSAEELCKRLGEMDITAERKSIYSDIETLIDYGYDILHTRGAKSGYYLASREFELPEVYLLTDAVQAASFITVKKTRELVKKLGNLLSEAQAKKKEKGIYIDNGHKCDNEEIYYNIDNLSVAIAQRKKVELTYRVRAIDSDRKIVYKEKQYKLSPYALIWQNDHYYLVANFEKYNNLMHIRVDRMKKVNILGEDYRHFSEVCEYKEHFDIADYAKKSFQMYAGEETEIELECSEKILEQVVDRFSDKIFIRNVENGKFVFSTKVLLSDGLVNWILQFGNDIKVKGPCTFKNLVSEKVKELAEIYE